MINRNLTFIGVLIAMTLSLSSCDQCRGPFGKEKLVCDNGGTCNGGICDCLRGYTGEHCDVLDFCELNEVECIQGECTDGTCICEVGYEGEDCSVESRAKFIGVYRVTEFCEELDTVGGHLISIERDDVDFSKMIIRNVFFWDNFKINGVFSPLEAFANEDSDGFRIPSQRPDDTQKTISGSAVLDTADVNNIKITIDYDYKNGSTEYKCVLKGDLVPPTP